MTRGDDAHQLFVATIACWLGGVWSDALGASETAQAGEAARRCHELVKRVYGNDDPTHYERLRAIETSEVSDLKRRIMDSAPDDPIDLATFIDSVASAERETMLARRAANRVKKDFDDASIPTHLSVDEADAVEPLDNAQAFGALFKSYVGDFTHEARIVALLCAVERMEIANGLSRHLKVYAVERPLNAVFGVPLPDAPRNADEPLKIGAWLDYLTSAAMASGHPVPSTTRTVRARELLAWGGVIEGFADRLRTEAEPLSNATDLKQVTMAIVQRLDREYRAGQTAVANGP